MNLINQMSNVPIDQKTRFGPNNSTHLLAIFSFSVKHFVGEQFSCLLIHVELCAFLVGLLDDGVPHLTIDSLVLVYRVNFDHRGSVWGTLLDLQNGREQCPQFCYQSFYSQLNKNIN